MAKRSRPRTSRALKHAAEMAAKKASRLHKLAQKRAAIEAKRKSRKRCSPGTKTANKRISAAERALRKAQMRLKRARATKRSACRSRSKQSHAALA